MSTASTPPIRKVKVVACVIASGIGIATAIAIKVAAPEIHPWATMLLLALPALPLLTLRTRWASAVYMTAGFLVLGFSFLTVIGIFLLPSSAALLIAGVLRDADETEPGDP